MHFKYRLWILISNVLSATNGQLPLSKVQGVTVTTSVQDSSPALRVSWSTVNGSDITYTVSYSTTSGTQSDPPSKANCGTSGITGTSTTLAPLSRGTTYYIWVGAVSLSGRGPYSERISAVVEPRLYTNDASEGTVDLENGATLMITPSKTYDIVCSDTRYVKDWYRIHINDSSISRYWEYARKRSTPDVYATNTGGHALTLHFESFQSTDSGEYECRLRSDGLPTLSVFLTPTPPPPPSRVQYVTVTRTVQDSSPGLRVSWSAVSGSGITYIVCYSTNRGTRSDPPSDADCGTSVITGTSTTLGPLSRGTTYYIWVVAVSSDGQGPYSGRRQQRTYDYAPAPPIVKAYPLCKPGKVGVFWTPPTLLTGSTITGYSIQYRIGSSGDYTTATDPGRGSISTTISGLQLGKTYQVRVGARTELGVGTTSYQILLTNSSALQVRDPHAVTCPTNSTGVIVGTLLGGIAVGILTSMLALGIVCGACKLRRNTQQPSPGDSVPEKKLEAIYENVGKEPYPDVQMFECPAYERVTIG